MFFVLSKTLDLFFDPWWWAAVPMVVGFGLLWRGKRRAAAIVFSAGLFLLLAFSLPSVSHRLWHGLEADAPRTFRAEATYDVLVLLGGMVTPSGATPEQVSWGDNIDRLTISFELLRSGRARNVIVTGGVFREGMPTEAEYLARQLEAWGIEKERIIVEAKALNTRENATYSKTIIDARGFQSVLLVTSAFHMTRSIASFQAVGLSPDTLPVDYRMRDPSATPNLLPRTRFLHESSESLREWFGRLVYRITGR